MSRNLLLASALLAAALGAAFLITNRESRPAASTPAARPGTASASASVPTAASVHRPAKRTPPLRPHLPLAPLSSAALLAMSPRDWDSYFTARAAQGTDFPPVLREEIVALTDELRTADPKSAPVYHEAITAILSEPMEADSSAPVHPAQLPVAGLDAPSPE